MTQVSLVSELPELQWYSFWAWQQYVRAVWPLAVSTGLAYGSLL